MARTTVSGTVTRVFYENKAADVTEYYQTKEGEQRSTKYTAWFDGPENINVGEAVVVTGDLSAKIEDWKDRDGNPKMDNSGKQGRSVVLSINNVVFGVSAPPAASLPNAARTVSVAASAV